MGRLKKDSQHLSKAITRAASLSSIDASMDLGNGITLAKYNTVITDLKNSQNIYNAVLSTVDEKLNIVRASEKIVADYSERILAGVGSKYGKNSNEYEMAGGVKKSDRKRPVRKPKTV
jgi:hypothetical protein